MRQPQCKYAITRDQYDAVLFDLDGVITDTASIHAACWKQMFDEYLQKRAKQRRRISSFRSGTDYRLYVDGKPRFDGVRDFLRSRGYPPARREAPTILQSAETVRGLGNRKNDLFDNIIEDKGVQPYDGSVKLIHQLRRRWVQNRGRHLKPQLHGCSEGRQVG